MSHAEVLKQLIKDMWADARDAGETQEDRLDILAQDLVDALQLAIADVLEDDLGEDAPTAQLEIEWYEVDDDNDPEPEEEEDQL
jgi:hypothetical protein